MKKFLIISACLVLFLTGLQLIAGDDTNQWLEDVTGEKALKWVKARNKGTVNVLEAVPGFKSTYDKNLEILNSKERIPYAGKMGDYMYNFWRDKTHVRGIYRRCTLEEYKKKDPKWETVLDIDALAKKDGENWVYKGMSRLYPDFNLALVKLSRGGADAVVVREFNIEKRAFVKDGFTLPEAKTNIAWRDKDSLYVGTDFGKGSLTKSGYARIIKLWKRGTPLKEAKTVFECSENSVFAYGTRVFSVDGNFDFVVEARTFFKKDMYLLKGDKKFKLDIPENADFMGYFKKQVLVRLGSDWKVGDKTFKQGAVIIAKLKDLVKTAKNVSVFVAPTERRTIASINTTKSMVLVSMLDNVVTKLYQYTQDDKGKWMKKLVPTPENGSLGVFNTNEKNDDYFLTFQNFLTPDSLYMVSGVDGKPVQLKSRPGFFDAKPYKVKQFQAVSKDGTKIPYFIAMNKNTKLDGNNPTLLYGYGGFKISMRPRYSAGIGISWLQKGGVYVLANIRGGGEFGPRWHQAALKKNRHKAFEDFIAVAEDLVKRKVTSPQKLGIRGGSNGGLLVGTVFVQRPDLFNAVVCAVPLLDMKRYTKLLAGASWAAEYGDPDKPDMWNYIKTYSPYHNVKKGVKYPKVFFTTSTRDDRVHPGHARKMVARMLNQGHKVYYYENIEGGHGGAANNQQRAYMSALGYAYLYKQLMGK